MFHVISVIFVFLLSPFSLVSVTEVSDLDLSRAVKIKTSPEERARAAHEEEIADRKEAEFIQRIALEIEGLRQLDDQYEKYVASFEILELLILEDSLRKEAALLLFNLIEDHVFSQSKESITRSISAKESGVSIEFSTDVIGKPEEFISIRESLELIKENLLQKPEVKKPFNWLKSVVIPGGVSVAATLGIIAFYKHYKKSEKPETPDMPQEIAKNGIVYVLQDNSENQNNQVVYVKKEEEKNEE